MDNIVVVVHIIAGAVLAVVAMVMQLGVGPTLQRIPQSAEKETAVTFMKGRIQKAQDVAIILVWVTVGHLAHSRWEMIVDSPLLMTKIAFGSAALITATIMHFVVRGTKERLKRDGKMDAFRSLTRRAAPFEKIVLIGAPTAFVLGVYLGHG